jgi:hypothetical protein
MYNVWGRCRIKGVGLDGVKQGVIGEATKMVRKKS